MARQPIVIVKPNKPISEMTPRERRHFAAAIVRKMRKSLQPKPDRA